MKAETTRFLAPFLIGLGLGLLLGMAVATWI